SEQKRRGVPLLIANVTEVDRGTALILGFPPLPPDFFGGSVARFRAFPCRELTNLDAESDLDEMFQVDLTEATRLSANFPWGFSSAKIASRGVQSRVHLIDGGVFDNTGIATIRYVFERLHDWAEAARKDGEKAGASYKLADKVMTRLRKRGVILIEIDSGAKQEPPRGLATILPGIFEPLSALENVSYTNADGVAQEHIRRLKKIFDGPGIETTLERLSSEVEPAKLREIEKDFGYKLEDGNITMFHAFRVTCNHDTNVMTAWALAPSDKAKVVVQFLIERNRAAERIAQLLDIQARTAALLEQFALPRNSNDRRPADDLVRSYHDLLEFNREFEMEQRKSDLVQQSTYATLRNKPKSRVAKTASTVGHSAPHEMVAASAMRAAAAASADESEKPAKLPVWKRYESSPSKNLRLDTETQPDTPRPRSTKDGGSSSSSPPRSRSSAPVD
ncbi:MAG TPA: hypothetical protein PLV92_12080, partial [Pirellulaceae bacterium]|nr:hypothetical protein [Pirellulaceae bacterium]